LRWGPAPPALLPPCPMTAKPCPGVSPRPSRLQGPVPAFTIFAEMTRRRSLRTRWQLCSVNANSY
ncbi:hypothetical protein T10_4255, partial [Trichinella papuae]